MKTFIFSNRETHQAFEFVSQHLDRLEAILNGCIHQGHASSAMMADALEDWIVNERPTEADRFYDQMLESILLEVDFENLADAVPLALATLTRQPITTGGPSES